MQHLRLASLGLLVFVLAPFTAAQSNSVAFSDLASKAAAARAENDVRRAIELYGQALQLNPGWKEGWWYLGLLEYETDSYSAARDAFTHYIALDPSAGPAYALRGLCEFETGENGPALQDIERGMASGATTQLHNEQILRYHEALLLARLGRFQDALHAYSWFASKRISSPELMQAIGLAGLRIRVLPDGAEGKQKALVLAAGNAAFEYMAGEESKSENSFHDLFRQFPSAPNAHLLYGYLLFERDPVEAAKQFKHELEVAPANSGAHIMLAWASLIQNDPGAALPYAEKAEQEEPALPIVHLVLGRSLVETGQVKDGTEHLERARQLDPGNIEVHIALAEAYSEAGRKEDAWRERMESLHLSNAQTLAAAAP